MSKDRKSNTARRIFLITIFLLLFACVPTLQYMQDKDVSKTKIPEPYILNPKIVKAADLGLHNAAADLTWLMMIQYVGSDYSANYEKLNDFLTLATHLDPKFSYPYAFGTLMMPYFGKTDEAIVLAEKGLRDSEPDWRIPYYLGTTYLVQRQDRINAMKYFDLAAQTQGAPDNIKKIAANFGATSSKRAETRLVWEGIYNNSEDDVVKQRANDYITHLDILDLLDQAKLVYQKAYSKYPTEVQDLVDAKILKEIPVDPLGVSFKFDEAGNIQYK